MGQILQLKQQNPTANTSALESEIDQLVYKLYDLTEEEIAIVEKAFRVGKLKYLELISVIEEIATEGHT